MQRHSGQALIEGLITLCLAIPLFWSFAQLIGKQNQKLARLREELVLGSRAPILRIPPSQWKSAREIP